MTSGNIVGAIKEPTRVKVNPLKGDRVKVFEVKTRGDQTTLEKFGQYIKMGGEVTLIEVTDCTLDNCACKIGKIASADNKRVFAIVLDDNVDIEPVAKPH